MRFQKISKNLEFDNFKIFTYQREVKIYPNKFNTETQKYKDNAFMYNIHIYDKVRVLWIGKNQNQKLCNLYSLIINGWSITIGRVKIFDNWDNFQ